jgi:SET domain-containing protein
MSRRIQQRRSRIHGNGVFAAADIAAGARLIEYKGLRRTHEEADALYGDSLETGHTFLFTLNDDYLIDANVGGNVARWINHSCAPNCQAVLEEDPEGDPIRDRVFIEALRDIAAGEELTYNYGIRLAVRHTAALKRQWACRCGAADCTGTMLQPKR